jgi:alpha-glucosidase (family GH31 glycosyl hydrolase)
MIGADICGFFRDLADAEMCMRWIQLGAFHTFSRNHNANKNVDKDPAYFNNSQLTKSTRDVLTIRYELLPHMYTLMYESTRDGGSVIKALFFEFPSDEKTMKIDEQFLLGRSLLISPVLQPVKINDILLKNQFPK